MEVLCSLWRIIPPGGNTTSFDFEARDERSVHCEELRVAADATLSCADDIVVDDTAVVVCFDVPAA